MGPVAADGTPPAGPDLLFADSLPPSSLITRFGENGGRTASSKVFPFTLCTKRPCPFPLFPGLRSSPAELEGLPLLL